MAFIPLKILKSRMAPDGAQPTIDVRLMSPAFEPFFLSYLRLIYRRDGVSSFQFRAKDNMGLYHYANVEIGQFDYPEGALVDVVVTGDLPLDPSREWSLVWIEQDVSEKILGILSRDHMQVWRFDGEMAPSVKTKNNLLQYIFIGGAPKTGTTWVQRLLNIHPNMLAMGENGLFGWPRHDLLNQAMEADPPPYFSYAAPKTKPYRTRMAMAYAGQAERILGQVADVARVNVVVDKTSNYGEFSPFIFETLPSARYIHCVRHPLDVAVSRFFHERNLLRDSPELSLLPLDNSLRSQVAGFDINHAKVGEMFESRTLLDWVLDAGLEGQIVFELLAEHKNIHVVRYEDLLADFGNVTRKLYAFCGFDVDDVFLEVAAQRTNFSTFAEGRARSESDENHFFRKGITGDHLNHMTAQQIDYAKGHILMQCPWYKEYF